MIGESGLQRIARCWYITVIGIERTISDHFRQCASVGYYWYASREHRFRE
jgi:hypothetical protein